MATTAFPATAIFDSGATGRELMQAADEAAAQAAIGIDPSDYGLLDSDNTWTGDNTFDQPITTSEITYPSGSLKLHPAGGNSLYFQFGSTLAWVMSLGLIRPTDSLGSSDIGTYNNRIGDVMAYRFGATESMTIYKVGNETETTNTETLETKWDSTKNSWVMRPKYSGSGTYRDFAIESSISNRAYIKFGIGGSEVALGYGYHNTGGVRHLSVGSGYIQIGKEMYPVTSLTGTLSLGKTTNRWGLVASVDADISGTLTTDLIEPTTDLTLGDSLKNTHIKGAFVRLYDGANLMLDIDSSYATIYGLGIRGSHDNTRPMGYSSRIWSEVWQGKSFVRGNFTDANNYEYLETTYNSTSNYFEINSAALGTGTVRDIRISRDSDEGIWIDQSGIRFLSAGSSRFVVTSGEIRLYKWLRSMNSAATLGSSTYPFPAVYSDLFSAGDGSVTAPSYSFGSQSTMGIYRAATNQINMICATGGKGFNLQSNSLSISSTMAFGWRSVPNISQGHSFDTLLARDATGIIAQRNFFQDAPQAFRIYGTWTDASNGEWVQMDHGVTNANRSTIASMANGTGTVRTIDINYGTSVRFRGDSNYTYLFGQTGGYIYYGANLLRPQSGSSINLGTTTARFNGVYATSGNFTVVDSNQIRGTSSININISNVTKMAVGTTSIGYWVSFIPTSSSLTIGDSGHYWGNIYSEDGTFSGTVTANAFVGDGSGLTNLPGGGGNPFDQDLNTTDSPSFVDGDFSGTVTTDLIQGGQSQVKLNESASQFLNIWNAAGSIQYYSFRTNAFLPKVSSVQLGLPVSTARWLNVHAVGGSYENLNVETGGSFKLFNLGDSHTNTTNTEYLETSWDTNVATIAPKATGTGVARTLSLGRGGNRSNIDLLDTAVIIESNYGLNIQVGDGYTAFGKQIWPTTTGVTQCGLTTRRWSNVASVDADFSGTMTLSSYDDGAGNSGDVTTTPITSPTDSFWIDKNSTGTLSTGWVGLRTNYNTSGTAHSWLAVNNDSARLELGNGLRAVWQLSGTMHRLNMNLKPYTDNSYYNGTFNGIWTETWQGAAKIRGSFVDSSNYGYLSIEPDGDDYLIKANSLGTTADAGIKIQTSQLSAAGNHGIRLDADYNGTISFTFGGNSRGNWSKSTLNANVQVATNTNFVINRTWNNAATVFQGYDANITDTASDAESSLLNLKVGGTSYLRLRKNGDLLFGKQGGSARIVQNAGGIAILGDNGSTVQSFDQYFNYTYKTFRPISDNQHLGYVSRRFLIKANDIYSKGKIRSYNLGDETDVDAEYLNLHWLSDHAYLTCENTGTGTARQFTVGTHTNGGIRFNQYSNTVVFSVGGITSTKMWLNSSGLLVYGRVDPQGNLTRDLGTTLAQWRELFVGTVTASGDVDVAGDINGGDANFTGQVTASEFVGDGSGLTGLPSGSSTLSGLTDTNVSSPANGQLLIYDAVSSKWDNAGLTSSGGTIAITTGAGTINLENAGGAPSDRRLKDNIKSIENCLDKVLKMMPVEFTWKDELKDVHLNTGSDIGFIAQDIEEIEPKLVGERKDYKTLQYEKFAPLIVGAIKELYKQIEDLKN